MPSPALAGRHIVLGVCGGIAAYKAVEVCRRLVDAGATVSPVLTRDATRFVGEVTFSALAGEPVRTGLWDSPEPIPHTRLGQAADLVLVAPATARLIGSYAAGISSDLLTATLLATRAPVVVCPAMHTEMWEHPAVADNMALLRRRGVHVVEPAEGRLAGGDVGRGRLAAPEDIVATVASVLAGGTPAAGELLGVRAVVSAGGAGGANAASAAGELVGVRAVVSAGGAGGANAASAAGELVGVRAVVSAGGAGGANAASAAGELVGVRAVVSAGGTREPIDAVRFVGNRSSGKQGYAVAAELARRGASVTLVSTADLAAPPGTRVVPVETAAEMEAVVLAASDEAEVVVMAAAVADFRPKAAASYKLKKADGVPEVVLEPTPDILAALGARRRPGQTLVGFAAETAGAEPIGPGSAGARERLVDAARAKLDAKSADLIVANDVSAEQVGFGHDTNAVVIVGADGAVTETGLLSKAGVAAAVVDAVVAVRAPAGRRPPIQSPAGRVAPGGPPKEGA